jgi:hypothetical protein
LYDSSEVDHNNLNARCVADLWRDIVESDLPDP